MGGTTPEKPKWRLQPVGSPTRSVGLLVKKVVEADREVSGSTSDPRIPTAGAAVSRSPTRHHPAAASRNLRPNSKASMPEQRSGPAVPRPPPKSRAREVLLQSLARPVEKPRRAPETLTRTTLIQMGRIPATFNELTKNKKGNKTSPQKETDSTPKPITLDTAETLTHPPTSPIPTGEPIADSKKDGIPLTPDPFRKNDPLFDFSLFDNLLSPLTSSEKRAHPNESDEHEAKKQTKRARFNARRKEVRKKKSERKATPVKVRPTSPTDGYYTPEFLNGQTSMV